MQNVHGESYFVKFIAKLNVTVYENILLLFSLTFYRLQNGDRKPFVSLKNHYATCKRFVIGLVTEAPKKDRTKGFTDLFSFLFTLSMVLELLGALYFNVFGKRSFQW